MRNTIPALVMLTAILGTANPCFALKAPSAATKMPVAANSKAKAVRIAKRPNLSNRNAVIGTKKTK